MTLRRRGRRQGLSLCGLALVAGALVPAGPGLGQEPPEVTEAGLVRGEMLYQAHCGRCHGMLGQGGEGPSLTRPTLSRAPDHASMVRVIRRGIPGTGMPGTRGNLLPDLEVELVAAHVLSVGEGTAVEIAGDAARGGEVFSAAGDCYSCHVVDGRGAGIGPELTGIGLRRGVDYLYAALRTPEVELPVSRRGILRGFRGYLPIRAVTRAGRVITGMRVNEDDFTIQLRSISGRTVSLRKEDLVQLEKQLDHSLMPAAENMTAADIDDLVAYLAALGEGS
ncbi:c-type cytochrome [Candidatus Palauibacter sp.]|uniref:c-type cytochrome n=1 Tax=Candidatus Palauibacter sp. TaxID=3101350 RepID=UPI003AF2C589